MTTQTKLATPFQIGDTVQITHSGLQGTVYDATQSHTYLRFKDGTTGTFVHSYLSAVPAKHRKGDPLCKACRGTGKDLGSDSPIRDGNPVKPCRVCDGSGEPTPPKSNKAIAFDFFYQHAGTSYTPGKETEAQGKARGARKLAQAEAIASARGYWFEWTDDPDGCIGCDCDSQTCKCSNGSEHRTFVCECWETLAPNEPKILASLGGICEPSAEYCRVVEAELAMEALGR